MTQQTGNEEQRIAAGINKAIELHADGRTPSAVDLLADLAEEFPQAAGIHAYLSWFLSDLGRSVEAIEHGGRAVRLAPASEKASLIYFHSLWKSGLQARALDEMRRFLGVRPSQEYSRIIQDWKLEVE